MEVPPSTSCSLGMSHSSRLLHCLWKGEVTRNLSVSFHITTAAPGQTRKDTPDPEYKLSMPVNVKTWNRLDWDQSDLCWQGRW